jgi:hypothetical protein
MLALALALALAFLAGDCEGFDPHIYDTEQDAAGIPRLEEHVDRLPTSAEIDRGNFVLLAMERDLKTLAGFVPAWNAEAIATQQGEIDFCWRFNCLVRTARGGWAPSDRRQALAEIREMIGERAWIAGDWPTFPWWRFERQQ